MGTHAKPELTSPVSRGQAASVGVIQNFGTSLGSVATGAFTNNSLGGSVDRGGQSFGSAPVSPSSVIANTAAGGAGGGGSTLVVTDSNNLKFGTEQVGADLLGEKVTTTDAQSTSVPAQGFGSVLPKSKAVELPASNASHITPSATIAAATQISYEGVETSRTTGSVNDNVINHNLVSDATAAAPNGGRENGAATFGVQAQPAVGNASLPGGGLPTASIQVRDTTDSGIPNNEIPVVNGTQS